MQPILEIKNLSKRYNIHAQQEPYLSLRDTLLSWGRSKKKETFWALRDLSFEVEPGDTVGIIGKNGAGKSTLLKILSKITPPTRGAITCRGHVASLLEVGTGFHPELSGRENIFLNGSILGLKRSRVREKFDEIVDFSGVSKFIDTPLKHYSSGMQLRLAFAVAAFLDPEILVIDEVLAVGDAEFQKKCLRKMEDVSRSGRTILFVSHQLSSVEALCTKGLVLHEGQKMFFGGVKETINVYFDMYAKQSGGTSQVHTILSNVKISSGVHGPEILSGDSVTISGQLDLPEKISSATIGVVIRNVRNVPVIGINNRNYGTAIENLKTGEFEITMHQLPLVPGYYDVDLYIGDGVRDLHILENVTALEISERNLFPNGKNPDARVNTFIVNNVDWKVKAV